MNTLDISIVIAVYNESESIKPLISEVDSAMQQFSYELILVDDGSNDDSLEQMYANMNASTKVIALRKNVGQSLALAAGIDHAKAPYIATLDADLQNHPSDLAVMLSEIKKGRYDAIVGRRADRQDKAFSRKLPSQIANSLIRKLTGSKVRDLGCSVKVMKADLAKNLGLFGELHRFISVLLELQGARLLEMDVKHSARIYGESKYGWGRILKVLSDLCLILFMQRFFRRPIHLFGGFGLIVFALGAIINVYLFVQRILGHDIWGRPLLILGATLCIAGLHFLSFGVILEVLVRTFYGAENKKAYTIKEQSFERVNG